MKYLARYYQSSVYSWINQFSIKGSLVMAVATTLALVICWGGPIDHGELQEGDIVLQSIYAPFNFAVKGDIDEVKTQEAKKEAMTSAKIVLDKDLSRTKPVYDRMTQLTQDLTLVQQIQEASVEEKKAKFLEKLASVNLKLSPASLETLVEEASIEDWKHRLHLLLDSFFEQGILSDIDWKQLQEANVEEVVIRNLQNSQEENRSVDDLLNEERGRARIQSLVYDHFPESRRSRQSAIEILEQLIMPSLFINMEETEKRKKTIADSIVPVLRLIEVKRNELIISKGQKVTRWHLGLLSALDQEISKSNRLSSILGIIALIALLTGIFILYLKSEYPKVLSEYSSLILLGAIGILTIGLSKLIIASPLSNFLIPIPLAAMLTNILIGPSIAIVMTSLLALLSASIVSNKFNLIVVMVVSGMVATYTSSQIRRRSDILRAGFWVGLTAALAIVTVSLINGLQLQLAFGEGKWGLVNGFLCSFLMMGCLPIFESLFKITTNINLLELADLNHPLLRELVIKAPGTYHHSLVVGNLAESACEAVGANALLARVGAYYHDIGKLEKAEYFTENQTDTVSKHRHEKLSPHMSSLIIVNHIKNGIELATRHKLPKTIIDFIPEHQGTSLIYFFYQKALQQTKEGETVKEEDFRYPGPKPQSKETAVVLLADSVEAASRSLVDPTPARIRGLVRKMINNKFIDGQLDECNLTLRDLNVIAETFVRVFTGIFHTRVPYPEPQPQHSNRVTNDKDKKPAEKSTNRPKQT